MLESFIKFAVLATLGEVIGLRIRTGKYHYPGFGLVPRALVWGLLGITIHIAFAVFARGVPAFLEQEGMAGAAEALTQREFSWIKLLVAFCVSVTMNLFYAPVMMTVHKITDTHIEQTGGTLKGFFSPVKVGAIMAAIDWRVQWNFVFRKTIPLFWIPAHTVTFLLPVQWRILFAAILGVLLGVFLAVAANMQRRH